MKLLLCLGLVIFSLGVNAEIYRWTDKNGKVHFSDKADADRPPHSESIEVKVNSYKSVTYESVQGKDIGEIKSKKVVMYSTSWCSFCKKARQYFIANKIPFDEYDIEKSPGAKRRYDAMGAKGVPVILVGNKRMNGFSVSGFKDIYK